MTSRELGPISPIITDVRVGDKEKGLQKNCKPLSEMARLERLIRGLRPLTPPGRTSCVCRLASSPRLNGSSLPRLRRPSTRLR